MPGPLLHVGASISCPHGGVDTPQTSNSRVMVNGMPVVTVADVFTVAGCTFQVPAGPSTKPQPCVRIQWTVPAARVKINGTPALLATSTALCQSAEGIPQGPPIVAGVQTKVVAT